MKILGLIVEYNPFHNGHLYHLKKSLEITNSTHSIAVMSGNFLQRGEPALFDKYKRAEMAVSNGVDLVVELPTLYACQSAEIFAHGAITLLNSLNCIDSICFGSEHGDIDLLVEISKILINEPDKFKTLLKRNLDEGILFALARSKALSEYMLNHTNLNIYENKLNDVLSTPNNILGIEYIKSLLKHKSTIRPYSITRIQADYNSETIESNICSATAIRKTLKEYNTLDSISNVVPIKTFELISKSIDNNFNPMFDEYYFDTIRELVIRDLNILNSYFDVNEGIENKIYKSVFSCKNIFELQQSIKSKRYTLTKVKRILNNILLGITKDDMNTVKNIMKLPYVRILAFNDKGREYLHNMRKKEVAIASRFAKVPLPYREMEYKTTLFYSSIFAEEKRKELLSKEVGGALYIK